MTRRLPALPDPFILALLSSVALASLLPARGGRAAVTDAVADAGIVLLFFLHGAKLSRRAIWDGARNWPLHLAVLAVTFLLFPLLGLAIGRLSLVSPMVATGMLFLTLLPSTVQSSIAFTAIARGNVAAAVCSASLSNVAGVVLTPLLAAWLMQRHGSGAMSLDAVRTIALQLLMPFALGHLMQPLIGAFVVRHKRGVTLVDRGSILLVVYSAFGAAVVAGLWRRVSISELAVIALLCLVLLAIVLAVTWGAGRLAAMDRPDAIVLLFCGSKKSLASGVPIAAALFPAHETGLIILPLMLFHQLQLIACALIARQYARAENNSDGGTVSDKPT